MYATCMLSEYVFVLLYLFNLQKKNNVIVKHFNYFGNHNLAYMQIFLCIVFVCIVLIK